MRGPTVCQLKNDIDRGRTRDKVDYPDPAVVPLGTDDEAAGARMSPELLAADIAREVEADDVAARGLALLTAPAAYFLALLAVGILTVIGVMVATAGGW